MNSAISVHNLRRIIGWFHGRTTSSGGGETTYDLTLLALQELEYRRREGKHIVCDLKSSPVEDELPELNERQMLMLYIASAKRRDLIDVGKAVNAETAEQLVELGVMDSWLRVTDLGRKVLKS